MSMLPDEEDLGDGLILRTVRDERDVERYAALNATIAEEQGITCAHLLRHHREISYRDFLLVEDARSGEVVSTTCLIPWHCRYEHIPIEVAMLEMVLTHPAYRHHGLIRAQVRRFHRMVCERDYDLSIIEGIPYYYRQYGYAYAVDHRAYDALPLSRIPEEREGRTSEYRLRPATVADIGALTELCVRAAATEQVADVRGEEHWRYLLEWAHYPVRMVERRADGHPAGYIVALRMGRGKGTQVLESAVMSHEVALAALHQIKAEGGTELHLSWSPRGSLVRTARSLGSAPLPAHYQWLLRITDVGRFLRVIGPVLEGRLTRSDCAGLSAELCLNLFREAYVLCFREGKLLRAEAVGFVDSSMGADGGDLCIPPEAFTRLVVGYRDLEALRDAWPDIVWRDSSRRWLDVLFPRMDSWLRMPYMVLPKQ